MRERARDYKPGFVCAAVSFIQEVLLLEADFLLMAGCLKPPSAGWHAENSGRI